MRRSKTRLKSCFRGTLLGMAVADALGFPNANYSRSYLQSLAVVPTAEFRRHPEGFFPPGQYTANTQGCLSVVDAILERKGIDRETVAEHLIPLWRDLLVVDADPSCTEAMRRLVKGITTATNSGLEGGHAGSGALCRAIPIGLWNFSSSQRIPADTEAILAITHNDPRVLAAGAGLAAAIAHNISESELILGVFLDRIASAAGHFHGELAEAVLDFPRILSQTTPRALEMLEEVCRDEGYPPAEEGLGRYVVPAFLLAIYYFLKTPHDFEKTVAGCLRLGGNICATLAAAGALSGSSNGADRLPKDLSTNVLESVTISGRADNLLEAKRAQNRAAASKVSRSAPADRDSGPAAP